MYKIGIVGKRENVLCFMAAGFSVYEAETKETAAAALEDAAKDNCAVIFLEPDYARALHEEIARYADSVTPAVIPLPERGGGYGSQLLREAVERAVGADILFKD